MIILSLLALLTFSYLIIIRVCIWSALLYLYSVAVFVIWLPTKVLGLTIVRRFGALSIKFFLSSFINLSYLCFSTSTSIFTTNYMFLYWISFSFSTDYILPSRSYKSLLRSPRPRGSWSLLISFSFSLTNSTRSWFIYLNLSTCCSKAKILWESSLRTLVKSSIFYL
jgi:hypothetical protein